MPEAQLFEVLEKLIVTRGKLPLIPEIRSLVLGSEEARADCEAEAAWQKYIAWVEKWFHPDHGVRLWYGEPPAPELDHRTDYAARASGGFLRSWNAVDSDKEVWAKREFIEAWKRFRVAGLDRALPEWTKAAAKRLKGV